MITAVVSVAVGGMEGAEQAEPEETVAAEE